MTGVKIKGKKRYKEVIKNFMFLFSFIKYYKTLIILGTLGSTLID